MLRRVLVPAVQILSAERASVVAINNSVHVYHWNYFEDEVLSEGTGLGRVADEEVDDALHDPGGVALAGVHACAQEDALLGEGLGALGVLVAARDRDHVAAVARERAAERRPLEEVLRARVLLDPRDVVLQVREGVREAVREELRVIVDGQRVHEGQREEAPLELGVAVLLERVLVVVDVLADAVPADALDVLDLVGVAEHLHAIVVERVRLRQVDDVEAHLHALRRVANSVEKPLRVPVRVDVVLQHQVVLVVRLLDHRQQVP